MTVSVIIITHNQQDFIHGCLKSVAWADQIVVVDDGSTDETQQIVKKHNATLFVNPWPGFSQQKNFGAKHATSDWLLFLDSDERVSPKLKTEINNIHSDSFNLYLLPRKNYLLGKVLMHGGWYPDYQQRLVRRTDFIAWEGELHEHLKVKNEKRAQLSEDIIHFSHRSPETMLQKTIVYAKIEAQLRFQANHPKIKLKHFIAAMGKEFWYRAIKKQGYKDGLVGWLEILYQTCNAFIIYFYLWEMQQKTPLDKQYKELVDKTDQQFE